MTNFPSVRCCTKRLILTKSAFVLGRVLEAIMEIKDSAPGADLVRICYIREATAEVIFNVVERVLDMFFTRANKWEACAKIGQIVALFKKGDRQKRDNYRGVCVLPMISRILARVLNKHLQNWAKKLHILAKIQNGFRPNRSTADATQIMVQIQ